MDGLGAIKSMTELQSRFQPEKLLMFDTESIMNMINDPDNSGGSDVSACTEFATFGESSSEPVNAKLFEYRGEKVAGFEIDGKQMICLPQVYELFLKTMVGGLHTVYTKLRRLDISPLICNVEQVRALRGFGAIQPGVNRCKLIDMIDCDKLYDDCTNTCTRPGRPAKRMSLPNEDWGQQIKKSKVDSSEDISSQISPSCSMTNPLIMGHFLPQLTAQQLLLQHMLAFSQQQQEQILQPHSQPNFDVCTTRSSEDSSVRSKPNSRKKDCSETTEGFSKSSGSSENHRSLNEDDLERTIGGNIDGSELIIAEQLGCMETESSNSVSLSKTNTSTISNSEGGDSDVLENMNKIDRSLSPNQRAFSDRGSSSENSQPSPPSDPAFNKIIGLIDMASEHFKQQREALNREKNEIEAVRSQIRHTEEQRLRQKLDMEKRRSNVYFRRYCKIRREVIELKEQIFALKSERFKQN